MTKELQNQFSNAEPENSDWKILYKVCSTSALISGVLFLVTGIGFIISLEWTGTNNGWFRFLQSNWLIVIFKLHAGFINIQDDPLHGINFLDTLILALFSLISFGLSTVFNKSGKIWALIAFILSLAAIILFFSTQIAGRSTVMLSMIIFSFLMLKYKIFSKLTIYSGILAGIFLLSGDLTVGVNSDIITILFGIGYILIISWFFLIGRTLLCLASHKEIKGIS